MSPGKIFMSVHPEGPLIVNSTDPMSVISTNVWLLLEFSFSFKSIYKHQLKATVCGMTALTGQIRRYMES